MWAVLKFDKKNFNLLLHDLKQKLGEDLIIYKPKSLIQRYKNNKLVEKEHDLVGDYIFCFHKNFDQIQTLRKIQFSRGLKYFLNGFKEFQADIKLFIEKCKKLENEKGYISQSMLDLHVNSKYKFNSGPFVNKIFKIIEFEKNKIKILTGNLKTTIKKEEFLFTPA